ncbi:MAG: 30S ribosomal protein S17 [Chlamydiia bacterium]|jgi:small subunit ribosomal protein S17|nr:30S ribosomal protein S17 [Chlamydiota bacterium]NDE82195.1 30S ribosomal protein S17 [Chlamydiia bacterium]
MEQVVIKNARKVKEGVVVSNKMQKTVTVKVERTLRHQHFGKVITRAKKYYAHAENSKDIPEGQKVRIVETRPLSKLKRWRVVELLV